MGEHGRSRSRRRTVAVGAVLVLAAAQLVQPPVPEARLPGDGPITDHVPVPPDVDRLLRRACFDCHSAETDWPWYGRISPVSWLIANDVAHGRSNLDFSVWSVDPAREPTPTQRLRWTCRETTEGRMPPRLYVWAHREARLTRSERRRICEWTEAALAGL